MPACRSLFVACALLVCHAGLSIAADAPAAADVYDQGSRLELFVDARRIESRKGVELKLHPPRPAEIALNFDAPWERAYCGYVTLFADSDRVRMYYRGWPAVSAKGTDAPQFACMAESPDGLTFDRPQLGLFEFNGSKANNIVWGDPAHNFTPFKDTRPGVPEDERYKAVNNVKGGLAAYASADGIRWRQLGDQPVMTKGAFDSQNLAFWDTVHNEYPIIGTPWR